MQYIQLPFTGIDFLKPESQFSHIPEIESFDRIKSYDVLTNLHDYEQFYKHLVVKILNRKRRSTSYFSRDKLDISDDDHRLVEYLLNSNYDVKRSFCQRVYRKVNSVLTGKNYWNELYDYGGGHSDVLNALEMNEKCVASGLGKFVPAPTYCRTYQR